MISETPFALLLMALYEQIHMCTGRGKLYECAFVFEKMYEKSQIKVIFYKIVWISCIFWSFFLSMHGLFCIHVLRCHTIQWAHHFCLVFHCWVVIFFSIRDKRPHIFCELVLYLNDMLLSVIERAVAFLFERQGSNFFLVFI